MSVPATDLSALFGAVDQTDGQVRPSYNVAPTATAPIVRGQPGDSGWGRVLSAARWGLVPPWAPDARRAPKMINARAEGVVDSRVFGPAFARRRCLVPVDGWFEWAPARQGRKQPYFLTHDAGDVLVLAGLWQVWRGTGTDMLTFSVVTVPAAGSLDLVHHRMPLLLAVDQRDRWLGAGECPVDLLATPADDLLSRIEVRPVGASIGDVRNDCPELINRVSPAPLGAPSPESADLYLF